MYVLLVSKTKSALLASPLSKLGRADKAGFMNNSTGGQAREVEGRGGPTAEQALLLRLASAMESLVVYTVLTRVLPRSLRDR